MEILYLLLLLFWKLLLKINGSWVGRETIVLGVDCFGCVACSFSIVFLYFSVCLFAVLGCMLFFRGLFYLQCDFVLHCLVFWSSCFECFVLSWVFIVIFFYTIHCPVTIISKTLHFNWMNLKYKVLFIIVTEGCIF